MNQLLPPIAIAAAAALAAAAVLSTGCASGPRAESGETALVMDDTPIQGREAVLVVYGMSCPLCANNVDKTLMDVPGVTGVAVDMSTGRTRVELDGQTPVTRKQLAAAVDRSGFSLQRIETP